MRACVQLHKSLAGFMFNLVRRAQGLAILADSSRYLDLQLLRGTMRKCSDPDGDTTTVRPWSVAVHATDRIGRFPWTPHKVPNNLRVWHVSESGARTIGCTWLKKTLVQVYFFATFLLIADTDELLSWTFLVSVCLIIPSEWSSVSSFETAANQAARTITNTVPQGS